MYIRLMHFRYLDESGGIERPTITGPYLPSWRLSASSSTPVSALDHMLIEAKGSDVLKMTRSPSRDRRRQAWLVRSEVLRMQRNYDCKIIGRV